MLNDFKGMTRVKQVIRPFFDGYLDRSMVKSHILSGAFLNVIPHRGRVSANFIQLFLGY
jgi:hypothetical protein